MDATPPELRLNRPLVLSGVVVLLVMINAAFAAAEVRRMTAGPVTAKCVMTDDAVKTRFSPFVFSNVPNANCSVVIAPGRTALINARFHGTTLCFGPQPFHHCEIRILIGGVPGEPTGTSSTVHVFDSAAGGSEDMESHAMEAHRCMRNGGTTPLIVGVQVQWSANFNGGFFRLDATSLAVERADNCSPVR